MARANRRLECPDCEEMTLGVIGSDVDENNVGLRRYQCSECANRFTTVETFFLDDRGNPDSFLQLALNHRLALREKYYRHLGGYRRPRRQLKAIDAVVAHQRNGRVTVSYRRNPDKRAIFIECKRGHKFTESNTYINAKSGYQVCKACRRASQREWAQRNRASINARGRVWDAANRTKKREYDARRRVQRKAIAA